MTAFGNIGTGHESVVLLKEEPSFAGTITTATSVWLRYHEHNFQTVPSIVKSDYAATDELGIAKTVVKTVTGNMRVEIDCTTIGWLLKWMMGNASASQQGGTSEYKHTFKFGSSPKSFKSFVNEGGMSTPRYQNYLGLVPDHISINQPLYDSSFAEMGFVGKKPDTGSNPGTPTYISDNQTIAYSGFSVKMGTAGETAIGNMAAWTDPYDMRLELSRDIKADNFVSDGTGFTTGISKGVPGISGNFVTQLTTNHKIATFEAGTEVSLGVTLDSGTAIPSGNGSNYKMDIVIPRCILKSYPRPMNGPGPINPVVDILPMKDPTAAYSIRIDLFNDTASYPDAT